MFRMKTKNNNYLYSRPVTCTNLVGANSLARLSRFVTDERWAEIESSLPAKCSSTNRGGRPRDLCGYSIGKRPFLTKGVHLSRLQFLLDYANLPKSYCRCSSSMRTPLVDLGCTKVTNVPLTCSGSLNRNFMPFVPNVLSSSRMSSTSRER